MTAPSFDRESGINHPPGLQYFPQLIMSILEQDFFKLANEQYASLVNSLRAEDAQTWEHGEVESHITVWGTELMRQLFQAHLDLRYAQEEYQKEVGSYAKQLVFSKRDRAY